MNLTRYTDGFFQVSPTHGFLPCKDPLKSLPSSYKTLQLLLDDLPRQKENGEKGVLGINGEIEKRVADLPNFIKKVAQESDPFILQALFRAYAFLSSAYTLAPAHFAQLETGKYGKANQQLPAQLAIPFCAVAEKLKVYPWLDYHYAYSLGNYVKRDSTKGFMWENLDMAVKFSGMPDERGFIMLHVDINQYSPELIKGVLGTLEKIDENKTKSKINTSLDQCYQAMIKINGRRKIMWEASRWKHYNDFRVFIMGIKGNQAIFNEGVYYEGVDEKARQYRGQTGAQDNIIPTMDIFTGVINYYPTNELTAYLMDLRAYRPVCVQHFFEDLKEDMTQLHPEGLMGWLNDCGNEEGLVLLLGILEEIYFFRNGHWQFVQKYIMQNTTYASATGGTPIISWIPNQIMSVLNAMQACIELISKQEDNPLFIRIKEALPRKKSLLEKQLALLHRDNYSAEEVYALNKTHKLKD
ncbi:indoleamine 2,3-dioxygenase [Flavobacteriaceae bacterium]|nr:indoleamine 2,3-dioxygenase [Flavobacteriaceae bacterium]